MIKKIQVSELSPGMYIHDLNCSWLDHPFIHNQFRIENPSDIEKLLDYGINSVYIDTDLGLDVKHAPSANEVSDILEDRLHSIGASAKFTASKPVPIEQELIQASSIHKEANKLLRSILLDYRLGKQVELEKLQPTVSAIADSIFRNPDAILSLLRIKQADNYTFQHSVAVGALLMSFCHSLDLDRGVIEQVGIGGLLHDIGKMQVPNRILNKPGSLDEAEFKIMKQHVNFGCDILKNNSQLSAQAFGVVAEHHERYDGGGYPKGLKGDEIGLYGQMAAIVDVYDALTSNRVYHKGAEPTEVLKKLLEWSEHHFNAQLVRHFIRTTGIYPVGALVKLESGYLAVVIEQHHQDLLHPKVRKIFNCRSRTYVPPKDFDLSAPGGQDRILSFEIPDRWHIDISHYMRL